MSVIDPNEPCPCGSGKTYAECHQPLQTKKRPSAIIERIRLKVIPEPEPKTRAILNYTGEGTIVIMAYHSEISFDCGKCGAPLIVGMLPEQVVNIVIKCNGCGSFNDTGGIMI
jgi:hypothetical protein